MANYKPIECSLYDVLEVVALRRATVVIETLEDGVTLKRTIKAADMVSRERQEFLKGTDQSSGEEVLIRLDKIRNIMDLAEWKTEPPAFC